MNKDINLRQQRFIECYLDSGNATDALIKAGYKAKYADRAAHILLQKPYIKAKLEKIREKMNSSSGLTCEYKLNVLHKGIKYYEAAEDYDKAAKLIEVANKMQGHIMAAQIETTNINATYEDIRNAKQAYKQEQ